MLKRLILIAAILMQGFGVSVQANDSVAEIGAGGVMIGRNDLIRLEREDLAISADLVTVDYVFVNESDTDIETIVAFPMPAIQAEYDSAISVPEQQNDNFLGFSVELDGRAIVPKLDQRAVAAGVDVTGDLAERGIPLLPVADETRSALGRLPADVLVDWTARGIVQSQTYDAGKGPVTEVIARWELRSAYWWTARFPARKAVSVSHRYRPAVGASAGLNFIWDDQRSDFYDEYARKYCMDEAFERAVRRKLAAGGAWEQRIDYILTSGGNWANGVIGTFHLTVDKGATNTLVSFCGTGVEKTGPTRFEMTTTDFYPEKDIHILLVQPAAQ